MVAKRRVSAVIVTLALSIVLIGTVQFLSSGKPPGDVSAVFGELFNTRFIGVPTPVLFWVALTLVVSLVLAFTVYGRFMESVGENMQAAHFSGVPVERTVVVAHIVAGLMAAIAALVQTASIAVGSVRVGLDLRILSVAATILGGVVFGKGEGGVWGPFFGVLCVAFLFRRYDDVRYRRSRQAGCPRHHHSLRRHLLWLAFGTKLTQSHGETEMTDKRSIMCFGDSLTWGWIPVAESAPTYRYPFEQRWTGAMLSELGDGYRVIEEGLSARTTSLDDPNDPRLNGSAYLPTALASHLPLDLVIVLLGTYKTKSYFHRTPYEIANGMGKLVGQILTSAGGVGTPYPAPKALIVAPPPLAPMPDPWFEGMFGGGYEKSKELAKHYKALAAFMKVDFLDAGQFVTTDGVDGIHFSAETNVKLGQAIAAKVREILSPEPGEQAA